MVDDRPFRVWVTRPEEDAAGLVEALRARGMAVLAAPLLRVVWLDGPPLDLTGVTALLATSANGVRAFARRNPQRTIPVLAVGDATARCAHELGFADVDSAGGDVTSLAALVGARLDPAAGTLLHVAASDVAGDLGGSLAAAGFTYRREVLYEARPVESLSPPVRAALIGQRLDGVLVFSPRTGRILVDALEHAGLAAASQHLTCFCLSAAVADGVRALSWARVVVALRPEQAALMAIVTAVASCGRGNSSVDSGSPTGYSTATVANTDIGREGLGGGMNSDTKNGPRPEEPEKAPAPTHPVVPAVADGSPVPDDIQPQPLHPTRVKVFDRPESEPPLRGAGEDLTPRADTPLPGDLDDGARPGAAEPETAAAADAAATAPTPTSYVPTPTEPRRSSGARSILALVVVAALAAGGYWGYRQGYFNLGSTPTAQVTPPAATTHLAPPEPDAAATAAADVEARESVIRQELASLSPRLDALEQAVADLDQAVDQIAAAQQSVQGVNVKDFADRIARLEGQAASTSSLAQQVRALEASSQAARETASKLATTVLAAGQLAQAVDDGQSFVRQLAAVRALGGDDPDIAQAAAGLEPFASGGIPSMAALRAQFPEMADAVVRAEPVTEGSGWTDKVAERLASLVTIRRTGAGAIASGGADGILAQAEMALNGGDLNAAVAALSRLHGAPAEAATGWLDMARARLGAEKALASLQQRAIARLSSAKG